ncbi:MAG: type I-C CRISPR-associated protein Cas8c/Csd1 [Candidatus Thiodiazotropha sp. (ex Clathrolucina costata)]|nr:type I-C CRISPR-associated protein Cas8c/Csd1 [Candidatus Thiodiazotropha taylori]
MILQALSDYYRRKSAIPENRLAQPGFEWKGIDFVLLIDTNGVLIDIQDNREQQGAKRIAHRHLVPQGVKKTSGIAANLLWDNAEYVLGLVQKGKPERTRQAHNAFIERIQKELPIDSDGGVAAVVYFLQSLDLDTLDRFAAWDELKLSKGNISFKLQNDSGLVCQRDAVIDAVKSAWTDADGDKQQFCLISGQRYEPERLHPSIKGVWGAQSSGANIVSFNLDAFNSYGKEQGFNAPVGKFAVFTYTTALNHLLERDSRQRLQVGDASTVFWAEKESPFEDDFLEIFREPVKGDDPDRNTQKVRALYKAVESGGYTPDDNTTRFYVLGLAPNAARIAVRFWQVATVTELSQRIVCHFEDLKIVHHPKEPPYPSLFRLLVHTATQGKADNITPSLGGELIRAVLSGGLYPHSLLQTAIRRNRAERNIDYYRAALIKAVLNRQNRIHHHMEKEITVALDPDNTHIGYRLGRLFAVLEKIQQETQGDINATIRDKFYGAASSSPLSVFSNLMKLKNHHLAKLDRPGRVNQFEKLIGEILDDVKTFPAQMPLQDQGLFAIGYYHQRQDFFKPKQTEKKGE